VAIGVARSIGRRLVLGLLPSCVTGFTYGCRGIRRIEADNLAFKGHCWSLSSPTDEQMQLSPGALTILSASVKLSSTGSFTRLDSRRLALLRQLILVDLLAEREKIPIS
jgi:hypothetical protein